MEAITTQLRAGDQIDVTSLAANKARCFIGCYVRHAGFEVSAVEARSLLDGGTPGEIVRPYLIGEDISTQPDQAPSRTVIDFADRELEEAARFPAALDLIRQRVKPDRDRDAAQSRHWWRFWRPRMEMRQSLHDLRRFAGALRTGKRLLIAWQPLEVCPSDGVVVFAFDDDYSMGILLSKAHDAWAWAQASTLKGDLRYTPTSVFMTFPFPDPVTDEQREAVAEASRRLLARRTEICTTEQMGLTKLYNAVDEGAWTDLVALHRTLDEAVADCYGWPKAIAQDATDLVARLTERNREISEGERGYAPFP